MNNITKRTRRRKTDGNKVSETMEKIHYLEFERACDKFLKDRDPTYSNYLKRTQNKL